MALATGARMPFGLRGTVSRKEGPVAQLVRAADS